MGKRLDTRLSEEDRLALERVYKRSPDWRARERANLCSERAARLLLCAAPPPPHCDEGTARLRPLPATRTAKRRASTRSCSLFFSILVGRA